MKKKYLILFLLIFSLSCESPWDIDTPRIIILPKPVDSVPLSLISIYVETNGTTEQFLIEKAMLEIDTVSNIPIIWGSLTINSAVTTNFDTERIGLSSVTLNLKNLSVEGSSVTLSKSSTPDSYAKYSINRGITSDYDTTIFCDTDKNKTVITFSQNDDRRELWIYLTTNIFDKRYGFENGNTGNVLSIPDSLFVVTRMLFNY